VIDEVTKMAQNPESPAFSAQGGQENPPSERGPARRRFALLIRATLSVATIVILLLWVLGAFRHNVIQAEMKPLPEEPRSVPPTETISLRAYPVITQAVGTVQPERTASVSARLVADIVEMRVSAGQRVNRGDVLVLLDDRDLRHRVEQAQDAVRSAEATLAQAQSDFNRDKPLFEQQVITPYEFDRTQTALRTAEANLHRLQEMENEARVSLSYSVIHSPFAGVVVDKLADVGELAAPGKPLLTMYEQGRLWLEAAIPEEQAGRVHVNDTLALEIDAQKRQLKGPVVEVVPSADPSTRTVLVRVRLSRTQDLLPGMFGRLLIPAESEELLMVPESALIRAGQLTMVEVVRDSQVERRTVEIGRMIESRCEVLSGLRDGEAVVLDPVVPTPSAGKSRP